MEVVRGWELRVRCRWVRWGEGPRWRRTSLRAWVGGVVVVRFEGAGKAGLEVGGEVGLEDMVVIGGAEVAEDELGVEGLVAGFVAEEGGINVAVAVISEAEEEDVGGVIATLNLFLNSTLASRLFSRFLFYPIARRSTVVDPLPSPLILPKPPFRQKAQCSQTEAQYWRHRGQVGEQRGGVQYRAIPAEGGYEICFSAEGTSLLLPKRKELGSEEEGGIGDV